MIDYNWIQSFNYMLGVESNQACSFFLFSFVLTQKPFLFHHLSPSHTHTHTHTQTHTHTHTHKCFFPFLAHPCYTFFSFHFTAVFLTSPFSMKHPLTMFSLSAFVCLNLSLFSFFLFVLIFVYIFRLSYFLFCDV